jgi:PAS domain S-box-containing protein
MKCRNAFGPATFPKIGGKAMPLMKSEDWLQLAEQGSDLGLWYWDERTQLFYWDTKTRAMFGAPLQGNITVQTFLDAIHPEDRDRVMQTWRGAMEQGLPYSVELRAVIPDLGLRWIHARGKGYRDDADKPLYMIGVSFDFTERKQGEQERLELAGRLIHAQERERRRLARELHDDFSQRLAMVEFRLGELASGSAESSSAAEISQLRQEVKGISSDLHSLSHQLYSSKLEMLGLAQSVRCLSRDFAEQHGIEIECKHLDVRSSLTHDISLCLFRTVQESLRNVSKHSEASKVQVRLQEKSGAICLTVSDNGVGFDPASNCASKGIGIQSMRERARMLGGTFEIRSRRSGGTKIMVRVPVAMAGTNCWAEAHGRMALSTA